MDYRDEAGREPWPRAEWTLWRSDEAVRRHEHHAVAPEHGLVHGLVLKTAQSHGAGCIVPSLLMPEEFHEFRLLSMEKPVDEGKEEIAGRNCRRISGRRGESGDMTLWIDEESAFLRRMRLKIRYDRRQRPAEEREARLTAAGIPKELRPAWKLAKEWEAFETELITTWEPRPDAAIDRAVFEPY